MKNHLEEKIFEIFIDFLKEFVYKLGKDDFMKKNCNECSGIGIINTGNMYITHLGPFIGLYECKSCSGKGFIEHNPGNDEPSFTGIKFIPEFTKCFVGSNSSGNCTDFIPYPEWYKSHKQDELISDPNSILTVQTIYCTNPECKGTGTTKPVIQNSFPVKFNCDKCSTCSGTGREVIFTLKNNDYILPSKDIDSSKLIPFNGLKKRDYVPLNTFIENISYEIWYTLNKSVKPLPSPDM